MDIRFSVTEELEVLLFRFLRDSKVHPWSYREKLITALRTWWLPQALKEAGASEAEIHAHALAAIHSMKTQIWYLEGYLSGTSHPSLHLNEGYLSGTSLPHPNLLLNEGNGNSFHSELSTQNDYPIRLD